MSDQRKRAYLIYECRSGWCIKPYRKSEVVHDAEFIESIWAFSRLSQALWWLGRHCAPKKAKNDGNEPPLRQEAPAPGEGQATKQERGSPPQVTKSSPQAGTGFREHVTGDLP